MELRGLRLPSRQWHPPRWWNRNRCPCRDPAHGHAASPSRKGRPAAPRRACRSDMTEGPSWRCRDGRGCRLRRSAGPAMSARSGYPLEVPAAPDRDRSRCHLNDGAPGSAVASDGAPEPKDAVGGCVAVHRPVASDSRGRLGPEDFASGQGAGPSRRCRVADGRGGQVSAPGPPGCGRLELLVVEPRVGAALRQQLARACRARRCARARRRG